MDLNRFAIRNLVNEIGVSDLTSIKLKLKRILLVKAKEAQHERYDFLVW